MPFRCMTCQKLSAVDDAPNCTQRDKCIFERVAVIHYASVEGTGRDHGLVTVNTATKKGAKPLDSLGMTKLHCDSVVPSAMVTPLLDAVTCLKCLATIPPQDPVQKEEEE